MSYDPYWDSVVLAMHMDGSNGGTTFTEATGRTITVGGNANTSTDQAKFGATSGKFDGSGDYLITPWSDSFHWFNNDYTLECWIYSSSWATWSTGGIPCLIGSMNYNLATNYWSFGVNSSGLITLFKSYGGVSGSTTIPLNQWNHIALTFHNGILRMFVNGIQDYYYKWPNVSGMFGVTNLSIGQYNNVCITGFVDELRITNGVARYTGNFTPPTAAYADRVGVISCTLSESLTATTFIAEAHRASDGALSGRTAVTASPFDISIVVPESAHYVTVTPDQGNVWEPSKSYVIDDLVFPVNPSTTPYYYKRLVNGTSGSSEPTWGTTPASQCDDGVVTNAWELVEGLTQPITHGPLIQS